MHEGSNSSGADKAGNGGTDGKVVESLSELFICGHIRTVQLAM